MASLIVSNKFLGKPAFTVKHLESGDQSASVLLAADGFLNLPGKDVCLMFDETSKHLEVEIVFDEKKLRSSSFIKPQMLAGHLCCPYRLYPVRIVSREGEQSFLLVEDKMM